MQNIKTQKKAKDAKEAQKNEQVEGEIGVDVGESEGGRDNVMYEFQ